MITYLLKYNMRFFPPYNWHLNMWSSLKFEYETPKWIALNQTMQSQTKAYIA